MYHYKQVYIGLLEYMEWKNKAYVKQILEHMDLSLPEYKEEINKAAAKYILGQVDVGLLEHTE